MRFKIRKNEKAHVKVAVKIPPVKQDYSISGSLEIKLENLNPVYLPISSACKVPEIQCGRDLFKID